jgi:hypothetical protein
MPPRRKEAPASIAIEAPTKSGETFVRRPRPPPPQDNHVDSPCHIMSKEHRRGPSPTPTEACPATHAAKDMAAPPPRSRSRSSDFHAQQADTSWQPATVPETLEPAPRPPEAAPLCRRPTSVARLRHGPAGDGQGRRTPTGLQPTVALQSSPSLIDLGTGPSIRSLHATSAPRSRWGATPPTPLCP